MIVKGTNREFEMKYWRNTYKHVNTMTKPSTVVRLRRRNIFYFKNEIHITRITAGSLSMVWVWPWNHWQMACTNTKSIVALNEIFSLVQTTDYSNQFGSIKCWPWIKFQQFNSVVYVHCYATNDLREIFLFPVNDTREKLKSS